MHALSDVLIQHMFHLPVPLLEKIIRPVLVYLCLIVFLRLFGKRELAQLNPFDLVVLLSLSNTVQNAIIGDDNSVSGGVVGAFALLAVNWLLSKVLFHAPKLNEALEGNPATLIKDGQIDEQAMLRETLTHEELLSVLNKNNFSNPADVALCVLEPNGTFFVKGKSPTDTDLTRDHIVQAIEKLSADIASLRAHLEAGG